MRFFILLVCQKRSRQFLPTSSYAPEYVDCRCLFEFGLHLNLFIARKLSNSDSVAWPKVLPVVFQGLQLVLAVKVIHPKLYKKDAYILANTINCVSFSLLWPQKLYLEAKSDSFILSNFFVRKLKYFIAHVHMKKHSQN